MKNMKVVATDVDLDIAVLAFENNARPFKTGLSFSSVKVEDGEDTWSAGYPGLDGEPVWQFGKGNITNSSIAVKELLDPSISKLIQHSAPIDSGNSGGPLLLRTGNGYEVVGVNTWKFFYRQSTNIAIPGATVEKFILNSIAGNNNNSSVSKLNESAKSLQNVLSGEEVYWRDISKFISIDYVKAHGVNSYLYALYTASSNDAESISGAFSSYSPIEGFSYAIALDVYKNLVGKDFIKNAKIDEAVRNDDGTYTVKYSTGNSSFNTVWVYESQGLTGFWRLADLFDSKGRSVSNHDLSDFGRSSQPSVGLEFTLLPNVTDNAKTSFAIDLTARFSDNLRINVGFEKHNLLKRDTKFFGMGATLVFPIKINSFALSPYGKFMFNLGENDLGMFTMQDAQLGFQFGYNTSKSGSYWAFAALNYLHAKDFGFGDYIDKDKLGLSLGLGIGI